MNLRFVKSSSRFVLFFFISSFVFEFLFSLLFSLIGLKFESLIYQGLLLIPYLLTYYYGYIIFFKQYKIDFKKEINIKKTKISKVIIDVIVGFLVIYLINIIQSGIISQFIDESVTLNTDLNIITVLQLCLLAPIFEEFIFRGCIFNVLSKYNKVIAVIISSLLFSLIHMNYYQLIPTFVMGIVICIINNKNKSLIPGIVLHLINNLLGILSISNFYVIFIMVFMGIFGLLYFMVYLKQNDVKIKNNIIPSLKLSFKSVSFIIIILLNILIFYLTIIGKYEGLY